MRAYRPGDGEALARAVTDSYDHLHPFLAWPRPSGPVEDFEADARSMAGAYLSGTDFPMGVWTADGATLIGGTGFHLRGRSVDDGTGEIGMWVAADRAGRGLGTALLVAMVEWGFTAWPWQRIEWFCHTDNRASAAVARAGGLRHEGTLHHVAAPGGRARADDHVFALDRPTWLARGSD